MPDERDNHVMFSHPRTWRRDLDPFARSKYPLTHAEIARDQSIWGGDLSYWLPLGHVFSAIVSRDIQMMSDAIAKHGGPMHTLYVHPANYRRYASEFGIPVIADPNCPPNRAYLMPAGLAP